MVMDFDVCDFPRFAVTDWRLRRWRLCFLALMTATQLVCHFRFEEYRVEFSSTSMNALAASASQQLENSE